MALLLPVLPAMAAEDNDTLQFPSPVRGWKNAPGEAKTWAQTLLDWGGLAVVIVAVGCLILYFVMGRVADTSGSVQARNDSTVKTIGTIIGLVLLIVGIGFVWAIFWK